MKQTQYVEEVFDEAPCDKEKASEVEVEMESEIDPVEYERRIEQQLRRDIERDIKTSENERKRSEIKSRLAKKMIDEYYNGNPDDAPYYVTCMLGIPRDDREAEQPISTILKNIPEDDIIALETEVKKLNARQTEIFECFCDKEKFKDLRSKRMTGQYVSEYKKIEGLKSVLLDRLQMIYLGKPFGESFNSNFCEPTNYNGQNREYRF